MNNRYDISDELRNMGSPLADLSRNMPYAVPSAYFENLAGILQDAINDINEPDSAADWGKNMPFNVPAGYFETLTGNMVAAATAEDITPGLPKEVPFKTPPGYFGALPAQMLNAAKAADAVAKETKIIPLRRRSLLPPVRLAAAAVLLICIGLGSYEVFFRPEPENTDKILASVAPNDIQDYLQHTYRLDIDRVITNSDINGLQVENKDIVQYLDETGWDATE